MTAYYYYVVPNAVATQLSREEEEWEQALQNAQNNVSVDKKRLALKTRIGIPASLRGRAWMMLTCADQLSAKNPTTYEFLLSKKSDMETRIAKDIHRTFPKHAFFTDPKGPGQVGLFNVLKAYSLLDPDIGYCQGMSFIVGELLLYMPEQQAFWVLVQLVKSYSLGGFFCNETPLLRQYLYQLDRLVEELMPKLFSHFKGEGISPVVFANEWYGFAFSTTCRLWDVFFMEGASYLFRIALAILHLSQEELLRLRFDKIITYLKEKGYHLEVSELLRVADSFGDLTPQLARYEQEFLQHPDMLL